MQLVYLSSMIRVKQTPASLKSRRRSRSRLSSRMIDTTAADLFSTIYGDLSRYGCIDVTSIYVTLICNVMALLNYSISLFIWRKWTIIPTIIIIRNTVLI